MKLYQRILQDIIFFLSQLIMYSSVKIPHVKQVSITRMDTWRVHSSSFLEFIVSHSIEYKDEIFIVSQWIVEYFSFSIIIIIVIFYSISIKNNCMNEQSIRWVAGKSTNKKKTRPGNFLHCMMSRYYKIKLRWKTWNINEMK